MGWVVTKPVRGGGRNGSSSTAILTTSRAAKLIALAALVVMAAVAWTAVDASAQGSVRPPSGASATGPDNTLGPASDSDIWRRIRQGDPGKVTIHDKYAGVLIQSEGETWRSLHNGPLATYGARLLLGVLVVVAAYFAVRGLIRIKSGRSGRLVPRFSLVQRISHWFVAALFVLLGVTGLVLLYGKYVLSPVIGAKGFGLLASASMQAHNLFGPLFIPAIVALFITFIRGNGYRLADIRWVLKGGGFFGGALYQDGLVYLSRH